MLEFQKRLEKLYEPGDKFRDKAWARFSELALPSKDSEVFRYVKLRSLYSEAPTQEGKPVVVTAPKGVQILPLKEAFKTFSSYLQNRTLQTLQEENDPFAALCGALYNDGLFLYVPPGMRLESPIHIRMDAGIVKMVASLGKGSEAAIHLETTGDGVLYALTDWNLEEGAHLKVLQTASSSSERKHIDALRATLKRDASFQAVNLSTGSEVTRFDYKVDLAGTGSRGEIASLGDLSDKNETHLHVLVRHLAPHTTSNQLVKNILRDFSHSSFEGKIYVEPEAQKTEAYQLNANLLLSDGARAESKPNLEIFADDVKASHGATFGQLEKELLFYLQTRGLTKEAATEMLVDGFANEVRCKSFLL